MELTVLRYNNESDYTDGMLFIDGKFECFTLEDEARTEKVYGETCIPEGRYQITLRKEGGFHQRYSKKFPDFHKGMLYVRNVPGFEFILIHIGNTDEDTAGCLLVGEGANSEKNYISQSTDAYVSLYKKVIQAFDRGEDVFITYTTLKVKGNEQA